MKKLGVLFALFIVLAAAGFFLQSQNLSNQKVLNVGASSSFVADWGPGPLLKAEFEKSCSCSLEFFKNGDFSLLVEKIKLNPNMADVLLSVDPSDLALLKKNLPLHKISANPQFNKNLKISEDRLSVPYDWGFLSFVQRKSDFAKDFTSLDDFFEASPDGSISLEDPRTSPLGLQFLIWLEKLKGRNGAFEFLTKYRQKIHSFSNTWSSAYGLFENGTTKSCFSFTTSPLYHLKIENNKNYKALDLSEGLPVLTEDTVILKDSNLAQSFIEFLYSPVAQKIIFEKNFMLPATVGISLEGFNAENKTVNTQVSEEESQGLIKEWSQWNEKN